MLIGEVAHPVPLRRTFDYEIPEALRLAARPGARVRAPFGPRRLVGMLVSVREGDCERPLKAIDAVVDAEPMLDEHLLGLARWLARRTCAPLGECVKALLPAFVKGDGAPARASRGCPPLAEQDGPRVPTAPFSLTAGQSAVLDGLQAALEARRFHAALLYGVPASGKTEVYLRLVREAIQGPGQALYLLPEISLTRPFFDELRHRAGFSVALWHSQLGVPERRAVWLGLRSGEVRVVVGARSACLLPFKDLRLTVIDEEQDESFKQEGQAPLYHARDVAIERARRTGSLVVLGSATPSMEAMARVDAGQWSLHVMPERVSATVRPRIEVTAKPPRSGLCLAPELLEQIQGRLARREQVILLVNRRGFSNFVLCRKCGWVARCKSCGVAFVHHQGSDSDERDFHLRCHHCGRRAKLPEACVSCKAPMLSLAGVGTQKVVAELKRSLPGVRVLRMDRDTVSKEKVRDLRIYDQFKAGQADVLVGTKLVAKGFHFPDVTLVGVVDADTMLHMPDFRAAERTVQLLLQAAGRSGRADKPGEVLVQTAQPEHYAMQAVARGDYLHFTKQELEMRRDLHYPPASTLVRLVFSGLAEPKVSQAAEAAAARLREKLSGSSFAFVGPSPTVHLKLRNRWRYHLLIKVKDDDRLQECLEEASREHPPSGVRMQINVDPYDLF